MKIKKETKRKEKKSHGKPIAERKLERNGGIKGSSSGELESCVGLLGEVKDGVGGTNVSQHR